MRVLVRRLPNISPQQKPVRKSQVRQTLVIPKGGNNNSHPRQPFDITVAVDSRSALVCAEPLCASSPRSCSTLFTPAAQQLGGALNILPSPFLWSWALVEFRWTRRRLDCLRFGRSLIEAEAASTLSNSSRRHLHDTSAAHPRLAHHCSTIGLSSASARYHLVAYSSNNTDYIAAPACAQHQPAADTNCSPHGSRSTTQSSLHPRSYYGITTSQAPSFLPALYVRRLIYTRLPRRLLCTYTRLLASLPLPSMCQ